MLWRIAAAVCILSSVWVMGGEAAGVMKFTRVGVKDPGINNIEAVSFLIPAGWKTEGGVKWFPDFYVQANLLMKVSKEQTGATIEFLPVQSFTWLNQPLVPMQPGTNYMGAIYYKPVEDVNKFIELFYFPGTLKHLQRAKVTGSEEMTKVEEEVAKANPGAKVKAKRVTFEYERNGTPWEEEVYVTLGFVPWQMGTMWSVSSAYAFRAPKGELEKLRPVMQTTISTLRLSQEWYGQYMYVQQLFMQRMNNSIANARKLSETVTKNSEEIRQMFADSYKQRNESQDRISRQFSEYIRGVQTYKNPYEDRAVELPSGYEHAGVNSSGEYILSNQAGYDPNVGGMVEWRRMEAGK